MDSRDFRSIFRQMFGFPNHGGRHDREDIYQEREEFHNEERERSQEQDGFNFNSRGFSVYTDPLEMNRFFDQQLDEMLKIFGHSFGFGFGQGEGNQFGGFGPGHHPRIPLEPESEPDCPSNARDFMWKDDGEHPRVDTEVDSDSVDMRELDQLMKFRNDSDTRQDQRPRPNNFWELFATPNFEMRELPSRERNSVYSFGSSMSQRSVTGPNGSLETTRTVRSSDGSEVVTVTKQLGDKSYEVVTRTGRDGSVSTEERLVNMTEQELENFKEELKDNKQLSTPRAGDDMMRQTPPTHDQLLPSLWKKFFDD